MPLENVNTQKIKKTRNARQSCMHAYEIDEHFLFFEPLDYVGKFS